MFQTDSHPVPSIDTCPHAFVYLHKLTLPFSYAHKRRSSSFGHSDVEVEDAGSEGTRHRCNDMMIPITKNQMLLLEGGVFASLTGFILSFVRRSEQRGGWD